MQGSIPGPAKAEFGWLTWSSIISLPVWGWGEDSAGVCGIAAYNSTLGASESWSWVGQCTLEKAWRSQDRQMHLGRQVIGRMLCMATIYIAALVYCMQTPTHTPTAISCYARYQPTRQEHVEPRNLRPGRRLSEQSVLLTWLEGKY